MFTNVFAVIQVLFYLMSCFLLEQDFFIAVVKMLGHKTSTMTFLKRLYSRSYQAFFMNIISSFYQDQENIYSWAHS